MAAGVIVAVAACGQRGIYWAIAQRGFGFSPLPAGHGPGKRVWEVRDASLLSFVA